MADTGATALDREIGLKPFKEEDFVYVVVDEVVQPDPVPASWIGTSLLAPSAKKATAAQVKKATAGTVMAPVAVDGSVSEADVDAMRADYDAKLADLQKQLDEANKAKTPAGK